MTRVFLAHSSAQRELGNRLDAKLKARGMRVFYSDRTIPAGESFDALIRAEIARADLMVFLVSEESITSGSYALTELKFAGERWPNPRDRVLTVMVGNVEIARLPPYLRDNVEVLRPEGDMPTETAEALAAMRGRRRRRQNWLLASVALVCTLLAAGTIWRLRLAEAARIERITTKLVEAGKKARVYTNTCVTTLPRFSQYDHKFTPATEPCDPSPVLDKLAAPALVVAQTGYGKGGFLSSLRGTLAQRSEPSVMITYRQCKRRLPSGSADLDLPGCIRDSLVKETSASPEDASHWLEDPSRYVLIVDAIDDEPSRDAMFHVVEQLWLHQSRGGKVVFSSHAENANYLLLRYSMEDFMVWLRDKVTTVDVRGINRHSVMTVATRYQEHKVKAADVETLINFQTQCPAAADLIDELMAAPKIFRDGGSKSLPDIVAAVRALPHGCTGWRRTVLTAMLRTRFWSYCHDELCNAETDGARFVAAVGALRAFGQAISEQDLESVAKQHGFRDLDQLAFSLLATGVLFVEQGRLHVDTRWVPEE